MQEPRVGDREATALWLVGSFESSLLPGCPLVGPQRGRERLGVVFSRQRTVGVERRVVDLVVLGDAAKVGSAGG
jgi:hypothetical protein